MSEAEFTIVYRDRFEELCAYLHRKFPRIGHAGCEDLAQLAAEETLRKIRESGFKPKRDWWSWLRWLSSKRAIDYLRQFEAASFETLAAKHGDSTEWN